MKIFEKNNFKYLKLIGVLTISYIIIKLIDNMSGVLTLMQSTYAVLFPFILAFIIAYILNPIVSLIEKKTKLSKPLSVAITYVLFIGIIALASFFIFPSLYTSAVELLNSLPKLSADLQLKVTDIMTTIEAKTHISQSGLINIDTGSIINQLSTLFTSVFSNVLQSAISLTTSVVNVIFGFLISVYVLLEKENFLKFTKKTTLTIFGKKNGTHVIDFVNILNKKIGTYIGIKAIDSLIIGILALIGLSLMGSQYILLLAVIVAATNMIPYFGPFIGMAVAFFVNLFSANLTLAIISLIFLFLLQQFDAWYLDPHLIGNKVGLSAFLVIFAVTIGGAIYGPIGMILATPVASVIKIYTNKLLDKFEHRRTGSNSQEEDVNIKI